MYKSPKGEWFYLFGNCKLRACKCNSNSGKETNNRAPLATDHFYQRPLAHSYSAKDNLLTLVAQRCCFAGWLGGWEFTPGLLKQLGWGIPSNSLRCALGHGLPSPLPIAAPKDGACL